jgi:hypothetical protein
MYLVLDVILAKHNVTLESGVLILEKWFKRIDYQIRNGKILDEYEMAVADNLIFLTQKDHKVRVKLFDRLIFYQETDFLLSSVKWIVRAWEDLDDTEKNKIIKLLKSDRIDLRWIKAVLLTSETPPQQIQKELFGDDVFFSRDYEEILSEFPEELLEDCLHVYCGFPQPLWWLAVHHKNEPFWGGLIMYILVNRYSVGFDICLQEFLSDGVNGFPETWRDGFDIWEQVCNASKNKLLLSDSLIFNCAKSIYNFPGTKKLWFILIDSYAKERKEDEIISIIIDNIELLQRKGGSQDIFKIFDNEFFFGKIYPRLKTDDITFKLINEFKKIPIGNNLELQTLKSLCLKSDLRLLRCIEILEKEIENRDGVSEEVKTNIKALTDRIRNSGELFLAKMEAKYEYQLPNWFSFRSV